MTKKHKIKISFKNRQDLALGQCRNIFEEVQTLKDRADALALLGYEKAANKLFLTADSIEANIRDISSFCTGAHHK